MRSALDDAVGGEPRAVEEQLQRVKALHNEILSQGRLIDNAKEVSCGLFLITDTYKPSLRTSMFTS